MADQSQIAIELSAIDNATAVFTKVQGAMDVLSKSGMMLKDVLGAVGIGFGMHEIISFAERAIELGDSLAKLHERTGFSVEGLSELRLAAKLADQDFQAVGSAITKFEKNLVEASNETSKMGKMMTALGVDITQGPEKAFNEFLKTANKIEDPALKVAVFKEAFGKTGDQMILVAGDMERAEKAARSLGLVMSEETAMAAKELSDNMKLLNTGGEKLSVLLLGEMAKGLTTFVGQIAQGAEEGNKLLTVVKELAKLDLAFLGRITGFDNAAQRAFEAVDGMGKPTGVSGKIRDPDGRPVGSKPEALFSEEEIRKILAGNDGTGKDKEIDYIKIRGLAIVKMQQEIEAKRTEAAEAENARNKEFLDQQLADEKAADLERQKLLDQDLKNQLASWQAQMDADDRMYTAIANRMTETKKVADDTGRWARELGLTFTSAFESAVAKGNNLRTVLQGLGQDLVKIMARNMITEPLGKEVSAAIGGSSGISAWFKGLFGSSSSAGGSMSLDTPAARASGGPVSGGSSYLVGEHGPEMFTPAGNGQISPNGAQGGGTVNINFSVTAMDSRSFGQSMVQNRTLIVGIINDAMRKGGMSGAFPV